MGTAKHQWGMVGFAPTSMVSKTIFFVTDFALPMDTAGYAPAIAAYEAAVLLLN